MSMKTITMIAVLFLCGCANMTEKQKDGWTIAAMVVVGAVLVSTYDHSPPTMCDDNPHTLQPPCAAASQ